MHDSSINITGGATTSEPMDDAGVTETSAARIAEDAAIDDLFDRSDWPERPEQRAAEPSWLVDIDDDIRLDLEAIGVNIASDLSSTDLIARMAASKRQATAALFLRLAAEHEAEASKQDANKRDEMMVIAAHYDRRILAERRQRDHFLRVVEDLARVSMDAGDFGKKKSASTAWGEFGVRDKKASVQLVDPTALVAHLAEHRPEFVRVKTTLPLSDARQYLSPSELEEAKMEPAWSLVKGKIDPDGTLPPGVEKIPASRTPFATPDELIVSGSAGSLPRLSSGAVSAVKEAA